MNVEIYNSKENTEEQQKYARKLQRKINMKRFQEKLKKGINVINEIETIDDKELYDLFEK